MPREFSRSERVAGQLRRELAILIQKEVKDPKVGMVGISDVEVSRDLAYAKVYVSVLETERTEASVRGLNRAAGFLRSQLASQLHMRRVPELRFHADRSLETGAKIEDLLDQALHQDRAARRARGEDEDSGGEDR